MAKLSNRPHHAMRLIHRTSFPSFASAQRSHRFGHAAETSAGLQLLHEVGHGIPMGVGMGFGMMLGQPVLKWTARQLQRLGQQLKRWLT